MAAFVSVDDLKIGTVTASAEDVPFPEGVKLFSELRRRPYKGKDRDEVRNRGAAGLKVPNERLDGISRNWLLTGGVEVSPGYDHARPRPRLRRGREGADFGRGHRAAQCPALLARSVNNQIEAKRG